MSASATSAFISMAPSRIIAKSGSPLPLAIAPTLAFLAEMTPATGALTSVRVRRRSMSSIWACATLISALETATACSAERTRARVAAASARTRSASAVETVPFLASSALRSLTRVASSELAFASLSWAVSCASPASALASAASSWLFSSFSASSLRTTSTLPSSTLSPISTLSERIDRPSTSGAT
ncbi:hypothetical protein D3C72_1652580 [compost metagenome]